MIKSVTLHQFKRFKEQQITIPSEKVNFLSGPNNSGKSTLLHALAVWNFCVFVIRKNRGDAALCKGSPKRPVGISYHDFSPINLPDLLHLWHDNKSRIPDKGNYSLGIKVVWEHPEEGLHDLEVTLALSGERLYTKVKTTTLSNCDTLPRIVYLPPIAGLVANEPFATEAERNAMLGKGLAGSILRNILYDLQKISKGAKEAVKRLRGKEKSFVKSILKSSDSWEIMQSILRKRFGFELVVHDYDENYNTAVRVETRSVTSGKAKRDLMVEGAGVLQWICVYAYALKSGADILLLDEPDAHLHPSLQHEMVDELHNVLRRNKKQIFIATHSSEILDNYSEFGGIICFTGEDVKIIDEDKDLSNLRKNHLGSRYDPTADKKLLFVESYKDFDVLDIISKKLNRTIPVEPFTSSHKTHISRLKVFDILRADFPNLRVVSLCDRDTEHLNTVDKKTLRYNMTAPEGFIPLTFVLRDIENYAMVPDCISRVLGPENRDSFRSWWETKVGLTSQSNYNSDIQTLLDLNIKDELGSFLLKHGKDIFDVWNELKEDEVHRDFVTILDTIDEL